MSVDEHTAGRRPESLTVFPGLVGEPVAAPLAESLRPLGLREPVRRRWYQVAWSVTWPKLLALAILALIWQAIYLSGWRESFILPSPMTVWDELYSMLGESRLYAGIATTMRRALVGFAYALVAGTLLGMAVVQWKPLRMAIGSFLSGMQTMPSIAWFPLAILLFGGTTETPIMFVVVLGAAPSIANGVIGGIDEVPPPLLRAGKMLGATGIDRYRHITLPAAMPAYLAGLRQGWAFAWRSLMAGELLLIIAGRPSVGSDLSLARDFGDAPRLFAYMVVILLIGMIVDSVFAVITESVRRRRGLTASLAA